MKKKAIYHNILGAFSNFAFLFFTSIVLVPYYFKFITTSNYGIWLGGISFLSLVSVLEANIGMILTQQLGDKWTNNKPLEFTKYLTASLFFGVAISCFIILFTYLFKDTLCVWVTPAKEAKSEFTLSFFLYAVSLSVTILTSYVSSVSQVFLKTLLPPFFNIIASVVGIIYSVWAIPNQGIIAIASGNLIKGGIYGLLMCIYVYRILKANKIPFIFEFGYVTRLIQNISFPLISKIGMTIAMSMQNFIIAISISASATTIFDITKKLPFMTQSVINMIAVSTFTSFSLFYSERKNSTENHPYTSHYFSLIRILLLFSLMVIFLIGEGFITLWVGFDKFGGNMLLALLCVLALSDQLRLLLALQYYAIGKFNLTALTDMIFAFSFMILAFILIPYLKLNGIVLAGIIANIIYFTFCIYFEKKQLINLVIQIINQSFFADVTLVLIISALTKFTYEYYKGSLLKEVAILVTAITFICIIFYKKDKKLVSFLSSTFRKPLTK